MSDQAYSACCNFEDTLGVALRDLGNRTYGTFAEVQSALNRRGSSDAVVCQRVRSKLGHFVSHPGAIDVTATDGRITLSGPVLASEVDGLLSAVGSVRGVIGVENRLNVCNEAAHISSLQGGRVRAGELARPWEAPWTSATRLLAGAIGCGLMTNCLARRTPGAVLLGTLGFGLTLRSITNADLGRFLGAPARRSGMGGRSAYTPTAKQRRAHEEEQPQPATEQADPGLPGGGVGRRDVTPMTSVYPASGPLPPGEAKVQPMGTFGQGDRGAEGYYDSGSSEIIPPQRFAEEEEASKKPT
jgi:hypothetical protein